MTVKDLIELLSRVEDKNEKIYIHDGSGYHSTDIYLDRYTHGDYLLLQG